MKMCCRPIARVSTANVATKTTKTSKICTLKSVQRRSRKVDESQNPPQEDEKADALSVSWPLAKA